MTRREMFAAVAAGCGLARLLPSVPKPLSGIGLMGGKNLLPRWRITHGTGADMVFENNVAASNQIMLPPGTWRGTWTLPDGVRIVGAPRG